MGIGDELRQVGVELRKAREEADLSQEELAKRAGISRVYISQLEGGKKSISLSLFMRIAKGMDIPPSKLIARIERSK